MKRSCLVLLAALCLVPLVSCPQAGALDIVPFHTRNQSPLIAIYGLPPAGDSRVLPRGRTEVLVSADIASNFALDQNSREAVFLDGETYRFNLDLRTGLPNRFEVGVELPYVTHQGGFLDQFIENWHSFFHLPQGDRNLYPRNQLTYRYSRNGQNLIDLTHAAAGLGDVRLFGAWQL